MHVTVLFVSSNVMAIVSGYLAAFEFELLVSLLNYLELKND